MGGSAWSGSRLDEFEASCSELLGLVWREVVERSSKFIIAWQPAGIIAFRESQMEFGLRIDSLNTIKRHCVCVFVTEFCVP